MGLLDGMFDSEGGRLGLGLLAAGSARGDGAGAGQRLMEAVGSVDQWKKAKAAEEMQRQQLAAHQQAMQMQAMQMQQYQEQVAAQKAAAQEQARVIGILPQLVKQASAGAPAMSMDSMLSPELRAGTPSVRAVAPSAGGFDMQEALRQRVPLKTIEELQKLTAGPEFSPEVRYDQNGKAFVTAKNGAVKFLDGIASRDKLEEVRLGDRVGFRSPYSADIQGSLPIGQDANSKASNAVTMRGQNMTDLRARDLNAITQDANNIKRGEKQAEKDQAKAGQVASFDVMLGSLDRLSQHPGLSRSVGLTGAFPTMPGSESANFKAELDTFQSQAFIPMVSQLKGMGALSDAEGKKLTAAVGALNPSMGEKAFRESVARITSDMNAARDRVTGSQTVQKPMESLPTANASNKGRKIRDTTTGKVLTSNGMSWVEGN